MCISDDKASRLKAAPTRHREVPEIITLFALLRGFAASRGKKSMAFSYDKASQLPAPFSQSTDLNLPCTRVFECENSMRTCEAKASRLKAAPTRHRESPEIITLFALLRGFAASRGKNPWHSPTTKHRSCRTHFSQSTDLNLPCIRVFECANSTRTCEAKASRLKAAPTRHRESPEIITRFALLRGFAASRGKKSMAFPDDKASQLPAPFSQSTGLNLPCIRVFECENSMRTCEAKASRLEAAPTSTGIPHFFTVGSSSRLVPKTVTQNASCNHAARR